MNESKHGQASTHHEARARRKVDVTTPDIVKKMNGIVMKGHQITVCKAVRIVSTSIEKVRKIPHKEFQTKSCARDGCCDC